MDQKGQFKKQRRREERTRKGNGARRKGKSNNKELTYQIKMKCRIGFKINLIYFRILEENKRKMKGKTKKNETEEYEIQNKVKHINGNQN